MVIENSINSKFKLLPKLMKLIHLMFLTIVGVFVCTPAESAGMDRNYVISDPNLKQRVDIYNDGRNTYIQAISGLIVRGATADGDILIVQGTPQVIQGWKDGAPLSFARVDTSVQRTAQPFRSETPQAAPDTTELTNRLNQLSSKLQALQVSSGNAAAAAVDRAAPESQKQMWEIEAADLSIYSTLKRWTRKTEKSSDKWQLSWDIPVDYPVTITGTFSGSYADAVSKVISGFSKADYPPKACIHANNVIRIVRLLGNGKECD